MTAKPDLNVHQAADFLKVSPNTVRRWSDAGDLPHWRTPGGHRRYSSEALAYFLREQKQMMGHA